MHKRVSSAAQLESAAIASIHCACAEGNYRQSDAATRTSAGQGVSMRHFKSREGRRLSNVSNIRLLGFKWR